MVTRSTTKCDGMWLFLFEFSGMSWMPFPVKDSFVVDILTPVTV
jgi:hypothetical protein